MFNISEVFFNDGVKEGIKIGEQNEKSRIIRSLFDSYMEDNCVTSYDDFIKKHRGVGFSEDDLDVIRSWFSERKV